MARVDSSGKLGLGPAAYLPPRYTLTDGQIIEGKNPANDLQYNSVLFFVTIDSELQYRKIVSNGT